MLGGRAGEAEGAAQPRASPGFLPTGPAPQDPSAWTFVKEGGDTHCRINQTGTLVFAAGELALRSWLFTSMFTLWRVPVLACLSPLQMLIFCVSVTHGSVGGNDAFQPGGRTGSKSHRNPVFWLPGTYHICWQGHCTSPEIKMLSSLSLFQAKCQESNYGRAKGLEAGKSQPHLGAARGWAQASRRWWGCTGKGRSRGYLRR